MKRPSEAQTNFEMTTTHIKIPEKLFCGANSAMYLRKVNLTNRKSSLNLLVNPQINQNITNIKRIKIILLMLNRMFNFVNIYP